MAQCVLWFRPSDCAHSFCVRGLYANGECVCTPLWHWLHRLTCITSGVRMRFELQCSCIYYVVVILVVRVSARNVKHCVVLCIGAY